MDMKLSIEGRVVKTALWIHDYVRVHFFDGSTLNVYNTASRSQCTEAFLNSLANATLSKMETNKAEITFSFSNGKHLAVGLSDVNYSGPEALSLHERDGTIVVWN